MFRGILLEKTKKKEIREGVVENEFKKPQKMRGLARGIFWGGPQKRMNTEEAYATKCSRIRR